MEINFIHLPQRKDRLNSLKKEVQEQNISEYRLWNGIIDLEITARGISKAHKQIVLYAKDNNMPQILIAEDDVHFTEKGAFDFFLENKPSDYDLYLGGVYFGKLMSNNTVEDFSGLTCYAVHARFYDKFLSIPENIHLDRALKGFGKYVVCNPFAVIQHNGFSDNTNTFTNYDHFIKGRKLFSHFEKK